MNFLQSPHAFILSDIVKVLILYIKPAKKEERRVPEGLFCYEKQI